MHLGNAIGWEHTVPVDRSVTGKPASNVIASFRDTRRRPLLTEIGRSLSLHTLPVSVNSLGCHLRKGTNTLKKKEKKKKTKLSGID